MGRTVTPVGKPDAGNQHVRFDERGRENGAGSSEHRHRARPRLYRGLYERFYQDTVNNIAKWIDGQADAAPQPVSGKQHNG